MNENFGETTPSYPNVLFVTRKWPPAVGGMELYSWEITKAYKYLTTLDIFSLPGQPDGRPPSGKHILFFVLRSAIKLSFRARHYDIIHFGDFVLFPLVVWTSIVAPRSKRLITVHGLDLLFGQRRGWKSTIYRAYTHISRRLQSAADCFVANSNATASLAKRMGFNKVVAVPLGVTLSETEKTAQLVTHDDDQDFGRYVLFVGRLVPRKGAAWFAENVLPKLPDDVSFLIVGAAWDDNERQRAEAMPRTHYLGRITDNELLQIRRHAAVTVMPNQPLNDTDFEGFGLAALEASAHGSILVASGIEGITDAVIDGKTGFLLEPNDANKWAVVVCHILEWSPSQRKEFIANAQSALRSYYSWDRVARDTLKLALE